MIHEQCRNDRDDFVEHRCQNVRGYSEALLAATLAGETDIPTKLCEQKAFAQ
jgi:hypothetical protein